MSTFCPRCKREFKGRTIGSHKSCGVTPQDLFWQKVDKSAGPEKCWPWTGALTSWRYGHFKSSSMKREFMSHRYAWELTNGTIPAGGVIMHACDNPPCCNPRHLVLGTWQSNVADCIAKGRKALGEKAKSNKLTADQVRAIRAEYKRTGPRRSNSYALAQKYGVGAGQIAAIISGRSWGYVK